MNRNEWEQKYADEIFDEWYVSDSESLIEFTDKSWKDYKASLEEQKITDWENEQ